MNAWLRCTTCGLVTEIGVFPTGCPACHANRRPSALVVDYPARTDWPDPSFHPGGIWVRWASLLPDIPADFQLSLGEGGSPLIRNERLAELTGLPNLYLKTEGVNPTGAHKDRFHAVSVAMARAFGMKGVISASTGNHGLSMSAYAGLHGLDAVVIAHQQMPTLLQRAISFAGGLPLMMEGKVAANMTAALVDTGEWMPAGTLWPMPFANPYGVEGYKSIAYEVVEALGEAPDWMLIPTAGGDLLCGIWRGLAEYEQATGSSPRTRLVACQPEGAAPLVAALDAGLDRVPRFDRAGSVALSIADPISGDLGLSAIRQTEGSGIAVKDEAILEAGKMLAQIGVLAEPSSVAPVAALRQFSERFPEAQDQTIICVLTSSALKWLDSYGHAAAEPARYVSSMEEGIAEIQVRFGGGEHA